jgi:hypothetical protein
MSKLRDAARLKQESELNRKSWFARLTKDQVAELRDLWEGVGIGEYSQTLAWRIFRDAYPDIKVGRSGFTVACQKEFTK